MGFSSYGASLSRFADRQFVAYLTDMSLFYQKQGSNDGSTVFRTFRIESKNQNKIAFEIDLSNFSRALKVRGNSFAFVPMPSGQRHPWADQQLMRGMSMLQSSEQAEMATVKLAKKAGNAFLSFEIIIQVETSVLTLEKPIF